MTAALSLRRTAACAVAIVVAALALFPASSQAAQLSFTNSRGVTAAYAQTGFTCYGRYVHYRADTFVVDPMYRGTVTVAFRTVFDVWNGREWVWAGYALDWTPANIGGQFSLNLPSGNFFRLRTQFAFLQQNGQWGYSGWIVEIFNGGALDFCRV